MLLRPGTEPTRQLDPIPRALGNVGHRGRAIRPGFKDPRGALQRDPADPNKRYLAGFLLPFRNAGQSLRREGHGFQDRRIDRPQRDVIRVCVEGPRELGVVMGRDAEFCTRAADRTKVRRFEIALAEMDEIAAGVDCMLPIIIDDEFCAVALTMRRGEERLAFNICA